MVGGGGGSIMTVPITGGINWTFAHAILPRCITPFRRRYQVANGPSGSLMRQAHQGVVNFRLICPH